MCLDRGVAQTRIITVVVETHGPAVAEAVVTETIHLMTLLSDIVLGSGRLRQEVQRRSLIVVMTSNRTMLLVHHLRLSFPFNTRHQLTFVDLLIADAIREVPWLLITRLARNRLKL